MIKNVSNNINVLQCFLTLLLHKKGKDFGNIKKMWILIKYKNSDLIIVLVLNYFVVLVFLRIIIANKMDTS